MLRNITWVGVALGKQCYFIASKHEGKLNTINIIKHKLSTICHLRDTTFWVLYITLGINNLRLGR